MNKFYVFLYSLTWNKNIFEIYMAVQKNYYECIARKEILKNEMNRRN